MRTENPNDNPEYFLDHEYQMWWRPGPTTAYYRMSMLYDHSEREQPPGIYALQCIDGTDTDGFHTRDELYAFRCAYNALAFNSWALLPDDPYQVHKSWKHHDGEDCFGGGWFIVMATLPTGQISNHYKEEDWGKFKIPERALPEPWDHHTPAMALERMTRFLEGE